MQFFHGGISYELKKNVASDILAPSADATHLHIARVRILRSVLSHRECEAISYETKKESRPLHDAAPQFPGISV